MAIIIILHLPLPNRHLFVNKDKVDEVSILKFPREVDLREFARICFLTETHTFTMSHLVNVIVAHIRPLLLMLVPTIPILVRSMSNSLLPRTHHQTEATPLSTLRGRANQWQ